MVALLPEAEHAINMMADSISHSFEKRRQKREQSSTSTAQLASDPVPSTRIGVPELPASSHLKPEATSESEKDDEVNMLSFTPRRRRPSPSQSRSESPLPGSLSPPGSSSSVPTRKSVLSSSSDEACGGTSTPGTSRSLMSPPRLGSYNKDAPADFSRSISPPASDELSPPHILTPAEHALKEELGLSLGGESGLPRARRLWSDSASPSRAEPGTSLNDEGKLGSGAATGQSTPSVSKTARSGSAGSLPTPKNLPANLIDAKELLKRRRDEIVYGISTSNSTVPSDDEASTPVQGDAEERGRSPA